MAVKGPTSIGDLKKTKDTIVKVLANLENDEREAEERGSGRANAAKGDPRRRDRKPATPASAPSGGPAASDKPWDTREWRPSDGTCGHCEALKKPAADATH